MEILRLIFIDFTIERGICPRLFVGDFVDFCPSANASGNAPGSSSEIIVSSNIFSVLTILLNPFPFLSHLAVQSGQFEHYALGLICIS